jgi:uncharacterized repeat protein (TIGR01451 family)
MKFSYFTLSGTAKKLAGVAFMVVLAVPQAPALPASASTSAYSSSWADDQAHPALKAFSSWTTRFSTAPNPTAKAQLISEGVSLAQARRASLAKLIQVDPQKALGFAVPASVREQLPSEVSSQLETRVSGIGDFSVVAALQAIGGPPVEPLHWFVQVNGQTYRAYVYGRRSSEVSKQGIPLHGIAIDGNLALSDATLRELEAGETVSPGQTVVDLRPAGQKFLSTSGTVLAEMASVIYRFSSQADLLAAEANLQANESGLSPFPAEPPAKVLRSGPQPKGSGANPPTAWTTGLKNVLVIRVDFSDIPGDPSVPGGPLDTQAACQSVMDNEVSPYYIQSSYGLTSMTNTVTSQLYRMPQTAQYYAVNGANDQLHTDAEAAANADYAVRSFDRIIVVFADLSGISGSLITYGGLANIGSTNVWVNGEFDFRVVAHELGHTYGLFHAGLYLVSDGNPISPNGGTVEYGDDFDTMGSNFANDHATDFNPYYKNLLGWLADTQVQTITANGLYRIYTFDWTNSLAAPTDPTLALKLVKDNERTYWFGVRRNFASNPFMDRGVYVIWGLRDVGAGGGGGFRSDLLDINTPGRSFTPNVPTDYDAALNINQTFVDSSVGLIATPLDEGGTPPNTYVDIQIGAAGTPLELGVLTNYVLGGDGNGLVDPNECDQLYLVLTNIGVVGATNIQVTISTTTPGVIITQPNSKYLDLVPGGTVTNLTAFGLSVAPTFICGTPINLRVLMKTDQGFVAVRYTVPTGISGTPLRFDNFSLTPIPDQGQTNSFILVTNVDFAITKMAVSVHINHPFDADLVLQLVSPDGVTNTLSRNRGANGLNYGLACSPDASRTTFDDGATQPISAGTPPFLGSYQPDTPLAIFSGKSGTNVNGPWQLVVSDTAAGDVGTLQCWSLLLTPTICSTNGGGECPGADLSLGIVPQPEPAIVGQPLTYIISVTNIGPSSAKNVAVSQVLPASVVFLSATTSQGNWGYADGVVTASLGPMAGGATATVRAVVLPTTAGIFSSSASVSSEQPDFNLDNNSATVFSHINPPTADLAVGLMPSPNVLSVGGNVTFSLSITNNGPSAASGVTVTNVYPAGFVLLDESVSQGSLNVYGNTVVFSFGALAKGAQATATITATAVNSGTLIATASATANQIDPVTINNLVSAPVTVGPAADVALGLAAIPNPVVLSSNLTFVTTVTNYGPSSATNVIVTQSIPIGVNVISTSLSQGSSSFVGGNLVCDLGSLRPGGVATISVVVTTTKLGNLASTASVSSPVADPNQANNSATVIGQVSTPFVSIVSAGASLTAESFSPANGAIDPGENVTVQFRLQNVGNISNTNLVATLLPTGGVTAPSGPQTYGLIQPIGVPGGVAVARSFSFTAGGANGGTIVATLQLQDGQATLPSVTFTFPLRNVSSFANTNYITIPDFGIASNYPAVISVTGVTGTVSKVTATLFGFTHTFPHDVSALLVAPNGAKTLLLSHAAGGSTADNVNVTFDDTASSPLSAGGSIVSGTWQPSVYSPSPVFSNPAPVGPYNAALASFNAQDPTGLWSLYILDDSAGDAGFVSGGWGLSFTAITPVNHVADLGLSISANPDPVLSGANLTYTFLVTNAGPNDATGVTFTNTIPAGATLVSAAASQGNLVSNGNVIVGNLASLSANRSATVTVVVRPTIVSGQLTNSASVGGFETDLRPVNNQASIVSAVSLPSADLGVTISANSSAVFVGSNLTYTVIVTNNGPNNALNAVATAPLPGSCVYVSGSASQGTVGVNSSSVVANLGTLAPQTAAQITFTLIPYGAGSISNYVSVTTASSDAVAVNNSATIVTTAMLPAAIIQTAGATLTAESISPPNGAINPGETVTLSLALTNAGVVDTVNLVATLLASGGVTAPSGSQPYGPLKHGGPAVARSYSFTASAAATGSIVATLQLNDGASSLGTVAFTFPLPGSVSFASTNAIIIPDHGAAFPYPSTINISGVTGFVHSVTVTLQGVTHSYPSDINALLVNPVGASTLVMSHAGGAHGITNVLLTFDDAAGTHLPSQSQITNGTYQPSQYGSTVSIPQPAVISPYGSTLAALAGVDPNGPWSLYVLDDSVGDSGMISSGWSLDINTVTPVSPPADMGIAMIGAPASINLGNSVVYSITITNNGPATAPGVVVTDVLPAGFGVVSNAASQGIVSVSGGTVIWSAGDLAVNNTAQMTMRVLPAVAGFFANSASVTGAYTDLNSGNNSTQVTTLVSTSGSSYLTGAFVNGVFQLTISGQPGASYDVQASMNLSTWQSLGVHVMPPGGSLTVSDSNSPAIQARYYRTVLQGP